jgi:propionate catabolism operon transcriptional regulator
MPPSLQSRLLRVLQEREVIRLGSTEPIRIDVRVIAATHRPLLAAVEAGTFRADLYYRLNILNVGLPPLRERAADIPALAATLLVQAAQREPRLAERMREPGDALRVLGATQSTLARYRWPGNVRELQNVIERIAVELAEEADENDLTAACPALAPDALRAIAPELFAAPVEAADDDDARTLHARRRRAEADEIRAVLDACGGDRDRACAMLGISKTTLAQALG